MTIEVRGAYAMGIALPVLETYRRWTDFSEIVFYVDDFLMGALLIAGAEAARRGRRYGQALLAGGWGVLCGGLYGSFFGQLARTEALDLSGFSNGFVVVVKGVLFAIAAAGFIVTVRRT